MVLATQRSQKNLIYFIFFIKVKLGSLTRSIVLKLTVFFCLFIIIFSLCIYYIEFFVCFFNIFLIFFNIILNEHFNTYTFSIVSKKIRKNMTLEKNCLIRALNVVGDECIICLYIYGATWVRTHDLTVAKQSPNPGASCPYNIIDRSCYLCFFC